jgi:hypothetical protein
MISLRSIQLSIRVLIRTLPGQNSDTQPCGWLRALSGPMNNILLLKDRVKDKGVYKCPLGHMFDKLVFRVVIKMARRPFYSSIAMSTETGQ